MRGARGRSGVLSHTVGAKDILFFEMHVVCMRVVLPRKRDDAEGVSLVQIGVDQLLGEPGTRHLHGIEPRLLLEPDERDEEDLIASADARRDIDQLAELFDLFAGEIHLRKILVPEHPSDLPTDVLERRMRRRDLSHGQPFKGRAHVMKPATAGPHGPGKNDDLSQLNLLDQVHPVYQGFSLSSRYERVPDDPTVHSSRVPWTRNAFKMTATSSTSCVIAPWIGRIPPKAATTIKRTLTPIPIQMLSNAMASIRRAM